MRHWNSLQRIGNRVVDVMRRYTSVFGFFIRSSLYKILLIFAAMCAVEVIFFCQALHGALALYETNEAMMPSLERLFVDSAINIYFRVAFVLVTVVLCLVGCSFKSNVGYTLQRLSIREHSVFLCQAIYNMLVYVIFFAMQLIVAFSLAQYYTVSVSSELVSNQTVLLAFYRNHFLHSLMPLDDVTLWIRNAFLVISMGFTAAEYPYCQRRHKFSATAIALALYVVFAFDQGLGEVAHTIVTGVIAAVVIGADVYMLTKQDEEVALDA